MNELRLGPLLRWIDHASATVWVETQRPGTVEVLGRTSQTFTVGGHHYALVVVDELTPGTSYAYTVRIDGQLVWPLDRSPYPPSVMRTLDPGAGCQLVFGSCRVAGPRTMPLHLDRLLPRFDPRLDALKAYAERLARSDGATSAPDVLVLLGDQVYADDPPRATMGTLERRHGKDHPVISDFEDYTTLYRDAWLDEPSIRWLLSTVPTAMIFDDHELVDNWDISASWVAEQRARDGWEDRLTGALLSYWVYQHIGNLSPQRLRDDALYQAVLGDKDGADRLRAELRRIDPHRDGSRWAFRRDLGDARLLVLDTRATRVLDPARRDMLDPAEWRWLEANLDGARHLLVASSVPVIYAQGFHELQRWSERVAAGAWGRTASRVAELVRRRLSLSGWPSFSRSLERLLDTLHDLAAGRRGEAPASITLISGDVHHGYVGRVTWPQDPSLRVPVHQVVSSPFRNPLLPHERLAQRFAASRLGGLSLGLLARAAGAGPARFAWRRMAGLDFSNQISTLSIERTGVVLHTEAAARAGRGTGIRLRTLWKQRLA
jgi:hypothetical protein